MQQPQIAHPAAGEELAHLAGTLSVIARETDIANAELVQATEELNQARRNDPDMLPLREMLYTSAVQTLHNLSRAAQKPYFTRVDFREPGRPPEKYYIGKYGVMHTDTLEAEVVDWRAPVANLYYAGQIGEISYEAPDGRVEGELLLKRQFGIEDGVLRTIFDTDLASQDEYLQSVLGAMSGDKLKDIVTTIQAEQNFVIRYPLNRTLIVQGVAGSGKTTIALHRIAYLLYAYKDQVRPEHMLILAPNPLFLNFIAGVLPDLGVEQVKQSTFERWTREYLDGHLPMVAAQADATDVLNWDAAQRRHAARIARCKGALAMEKRIDDWFAAYERAFTPKDGIRFGPVSVYGHDEMERFLLVDEKPFPMQKRVEEFQKQLKVRVKVAAARVSQWYRDETDKRIAAIRASEPVPSRRGERIARLEQSLAQQLKAVEKQRAGFVKQTLAALPSTDPLALYDRFWRDMEGDADPDVRACAEDYRLRREQKLPLTREDIAPFALLAAKAVSLPRQDVRHIVIDEAQDFNPLEIRLLQTVCRGATFTIVGDLMQGIHGWRGIEDWDDIARGVFHRQTVRHFLATSYRNTVEIMQVAQRIAEARPAKDGVKINPVLRHGDAPTCFAAPDFAAHAAHIADTLQAWKRDGYAAIAVIGRDETYLHDLLAAMPPELGAKLLDVADETYDGGVLFAPVAHVKGLEFDGVILADADAAHYPDDDLDARLLYVAVTRALHRLDVTYVGKRSPLLGGRE